MIRVEIKVNGKVFSVLCIEPVKTKYLINDSDQEKMLYAEFESIPRAEEMLASGTPDDIEYLVECSIYKAFKQKMQLFSEFIDRRVLTDALTTLLEPGPDDENFDSDLSSDDDQC